MVMVNFATLIRDARDVALVVANVVALGTDFAVHKTFVFVSKFSLFTTTTIMRNRYIEGSSILAFIFGIKSSTSVPSITRVNLN